MYNGQQNQQFQQNQGVQLISQLYQLDQIQQNFNYSIGTPYQEIEMASPQICKGTAYEIQNQTNTGSAVRINLFNYLSHNAFANQNFQSLCGVVIARVALGMMNREFNTIINAGDTVIRNLVRWFAAYAAVQNPQVMNCLAPEVAHAVTNDARLWEKQAQMVASQIPFEPFAAMQLSETLGNVNSTWGGQGMDMNSGAFVAPGTRQRQQHSGAYVTNTNDGFNNTDGLDRFQRQLLRRQNRLQGSMQTALMDNGIADPMTGAPVAGSVLTSNTQEKQDQYAQAAARQQEKLDRRKGTATPNNAQSFAAVMGKPAVDTANLHPALIQDLEEAAQEAATPPMVEPQGFIFTMTVGDKEYGVVRELPKNEYATFTWKPTPLQLVHPAWTKSKNRLAYFEVETGDWIAAIIEDPKMNDDDLFKYEAHAIDPTMGIPDPTPDPAVKSDMDRLEPKKPGIARTVTVNVIAPTESPAMATEESVIHTTAMKAASLEKTPDAYFQQAVVLDAIPYLERDAMLADLETICGFVVASDWTRLVEMIERIENKKTREAINKRLTDSVNNWLKYQIGCEVTIDSFITDAAVDLVTALDSIYGQTIVNALKRDAAAIVQVACQASDGAENVDIINSMYGTDGTELKTDKMLLLMQDTAVLWIRRTSSELDIGLPANGTGSGSVSSNFTPYAYALAQACFGGVKAGNFINHVTVVTSDGDRYRLSKNAIGADSYLIRKL